jgi:hypothetical protein
LGTHTWLRVAEWRDRADVSVFFFRFHSGGLDWNCEGSVKGNRREPRQRACPLTGSSQFRFRSCGSERKCRMRGMWFARLIVPPGSRSGLIVRPLTLRLSLPSRVKLSLILLVKIRGLSLCPCPYPDPALAVVTWQPPDAAMARSPVPAYVRSGARHRDQEPAAASRGRL